MQNAKCKMQKSENEASFDAHYRRIPFLLLSFCILHFAFCILPSSFVPMDGGIFITFEGSDGCGKSTQIERLRARLSAEEAARPVTFLREPGGTPLGEEIRRLLRRSAPDWSVSPEAELLLFAASRAQLVRETILPALAGGGIVVCDRFLDSTTVYQGVARRLDPATVEVINQFAAGERRPDVTFLLDLPPDTGLLRAYQRAGPLLLPPDRMEQEPAAFYEAVRAGYLRLANLHSERFVVLDASLPADELAALVWTQLTDRVHGLRPTRRP